MRVTEGQSGEQTEAHWLLPAWRVWKEGGPIISLFALLQLSSFPWNYISQAPLSSGLLRPAEDQRAGNGAIALLPSLCFPLQVMSPAVLLSPLGQPLSYSPRDSSHTASSHCFSSSRGIGVFLLSLISLLPWHPVWFRSFSITCVTISGY